MALCAAATNMLSYAAMVASQMEVRKRSIILEQLRVTRMIERRDWQACLQITLTKWKLHNRRCSVCFFLPCTAHALWGVSRALYIFTTGSSQLVLPAYLSSHAHLFGVCQLTRPSTPVCVGLWQRNFCLTAASQNSSQSVPCMAGAKVGWPPLWISC